MLFANLLGNRFINNVYTFFCLPSLIRITNIQMIYEGEVEKIKTLWPLFFAIL